MFCLIPLLAFGSRFPKFNNTLELTDFICHAIWGRGSARTRLHELNHSKAITVLPSIGYTVCLYMWRLCGADLRVRVLQGIQYSSSKHKYPL
jgi:hypothetical protein